MLRIKLQALQNSEVLAIGGMGGLCFNGSGEDGSEPISILLRSSSFFALTISLAAAFLASFSASAYDDQKS
jgi:hypothetical protein